MLFSSCIKHAAVGVLASTFLFVGFAGACGDDTSGSGGAGGDSAVTTNAGNGTGTASGESKTCEEGEAILCTCADESQGSSTCSNNAFSPCHDDNGDCSH